MLSSVVVSKESYIQSKLSVVVFGEAFVEGSVTETFFGAGAVVESMSILPCGDDILQQCSVLKKQIL